MNKNFKINSILFTMMTFIPILGTAAQPERHANKSLAAKVTVLEGQVINLQEKDLNLQGQIDTLELTPGPAGPQGVAGPTGPAGADAPTPVSYAIGDTGPAGGIVFYSYAGGLHGLEAAPADQTNQVGETNVQWGCLETDITGAEGLYLGHGAQNTTDMFICGVDTAADVADAYTLNGYYDWHLPSRDELNELYLYWRDTGVGGFAYGVYWSSSEYNSNFARYQYFLTGAQLAANKNNSLRVRAVRAF